MHYQDLGESGMFSGENKTKFFVRLRSAFLLALLVLGSPMWNSVALAEEEEQSGAKAAEILFGLAAIMAAVSPMVAAAIQADADKQIAKTNANAQMAMTKMTSDTSKYLADQQKNVALQQADIAAKISNDNQQATTARLSMQLDSLKQARDATAAADREKFSYQQQLDQQRIALAKQQSDETIRLANTQLRAQMTQAGISQGFVRSQNSATGLSTTSTGGLLSSSTSVASTTSGGYGQVASTSNNSFSSVGTRPGSGSLLGVAPGTNSASSEIITTSTKKSTTTAARVNGVTSTNSSGSSSRSGNSGSGSSGAGLTFAVAGQPEAVRAGIVTSAIAKPQTDEEMLNDFERTMIEGKKGSANKATKSTRGIASVP